MKCLDSAWTQHAAELRAWLRQRLPSPQDVDDTLQDVFLKALRQGQQFCQVRQPRAWLFEVARNTLADRYRQSRETIDLPADLPQIVPQEDAVEALTDCLPRVLSELSASDRQAIVCCDLQGMAQADYAAQAGLSLSAAKSRLQRARQRLRQRMASACQVRFDADGRVLDFVPRPPLSAPESGQTTPAPG